MARMEMWALGKQGADGPTESSLACQDITISFTGDTRSSASPVSEITYSDLSSLHPKERGQAPCCIPTNNRLSYPTINNTEVNFTLDSYKPSILRSLASSST